MLALSWYQWFAGLHTLAAVVWVGGGAMLVLYLLAAERAGDPAELTRTVAKVGAIGSKVFGSTSLVALASGIALVANSSAWSFGDFVVAWGLGAFALSTVIGGGILGPESGRLGKLLAERPPDDPEVLARVRRIMAASRLDVAILVGTVFVMAAKPFFP
ncbi:MAG: DUF2269 family protein [Thermoleophilia bacterium]|nr:DUF2269 family protein [Thermoleophilia bacterium]